MGDTVESFPLFPLGARAAAAGAHPAPHLRGPVPDDDRRVPGARGANSGSSGSRTRASRSGLQRPHRPGARALRRRPAEHPRGGHHARSGCCAGSRSCPTRPVTWSCSRTWPTATRAWPPRPAPLRRPGGARDRRAARRRVARTTSTPTGWPPRWTWRRTPSSRCWSSARRATAWSGWRAVRLRARANPARGEGGRALARQRAACGLSSTRAVSQRVRRTALRARASGSAAGEVPGRAERGDAMASQDVAAGGSRSPAAVRRPSDGPGLSAISVRRARRTPVVAAARSASGWNSQRRPQPRRRRSHARRLVALASTVGRARSLYHALLEPSVFSDRDGRYRGMDGRVHRARGFTKYADVSGWDVYRARPS